MLLERAKVLMKAYFRIDMLSPDMVRRRNTLNISILILVFIDLAEILGIFATNIAGIYTLEYLGNVFLITVIFLGFCLVLLLINNRWSNRLATISFLTVSVVLLMFSDSIENLLHGRSLVVWVIPVVIASIMAALISALIVVVSFIIGHFPDIFAIGILLLVSLLVWFVTNTLQRSLAFSRTNERALQVTKDDQVRIIDQLLKASKFKTEFMATMSHELRTPLNAIIGFGDILSQGLYGKLIPEQQEFVENIMVSSEHLLRLVNQFLDISKIESGKLTTTIRPVMINTLVEEVMLEMRASCKHRGLELTQVGLDQQRVVYADPVQLKEILLNLVSNAIKYTMKGHVTIEFLEDEHVYTFNIVDTGIGIAETDFDRIFKEFERIDTPGIKSTGTGLGLALTRRLVALHCGEISFTSKEGAGSTFTFTIPKALRSRMEQEVLASLNPSESRVGRFKVLIIEDNERDLETITMLLNGIPSMEFEIRAVSNLTRGVAILKEHVDVDIILLDLLLPESAGIETAQAVLNLDLKIPIIILTVIDNKILAAEIIKKGAQDYLVKNEVTPSTLERSIRLAFERMKLPPR